MVRTKRAYEVPAPEDGERVLVDRVWPRGVGKERLQIDAWLRDLAPSTALRHWFAHDLSRWDEFSRRYREELMAPSQHQLLDELAARAWRGTLTLVYSARDTEHNQAVVLQNAIVERIAPK